MKIENKIILISAILSLSFCSPPSGEAPTAAAAIGSGSETAATRKSVDTIPPGSDFAVSVPTSASVPESITATGTVPVPVINANMPVNANNELAPPGLAPRQEGSNANSVQNNSVAHNNTTPPVLPPPIEPAPQPVQSTPASQAVEEPQSFIDLVLAPAPAPISVPVIESAQPQNQSDIASQIVVPDSVLVPEAVVITPEVALEIVEAVQTVAPSAPVVVSEPSVSSSLALLVGASEPTPAPTPTPVPEPVLTTPEPTATATSVAVVSPTPEPTPAITEPTATSSATSTPVATSTATATSTAVATSTPTATATATSTPVATATATSSATSTATATATATATVPATWQSEITSDIAEKELNSARCGTFSTTLDTTDGVWYTTREEKNKNISGIETYWARQSLWAKFRGVCKRGYYRVTVMAKNTQGNLPSSYKNFEVTARNASLLFGHKNKKTSGLIEIKANENSYHQGSTRVWLEPGDNFVELKWMNDYYVPFLYDANIQIKKVWLEPVVTTETDTLVRTGMQFCALTPNGSEWKWYWKDDYIHTYWANQWAEYCFQNLKATRYKVSVTARNYGELPLASNYTVWKLKVIAGSNETIFTVPAHKDFKTDYSFIQIPSGTQKLRLVWLNDSYSAGVHDANIQIKTLSLEEAP